VSEGAQTCALPLFCDRDLEIKLEGDLDILKMYLHTENEAASLKYSKLTLSKKSEICCCDLDLKPMTLKLNRDLDILKMYV